MINEPIYISSDGIFIDKHCSRIEFIDQGCIVIPSMQNKFLSNEGYKEDLKKFISKWFCTMPQEL